MTERILRLPEVKTCTGLGRSTIYDAMARADFPQPVKLGLRAVGWRERDISEWLESRQPRNAA